MNPLKKIFGVIAICVIAVVAGFAIWGALLVWMMKTEG